ncbi:MAG: phosphatase PAP2 family protein [Gammaproteobacteria bacterium]|nr:phosphatase PAP2 family protein [Gammaproteobacteria bacterium]
MKYTRTLMGFILATLLLAPMAKGMASQTLASTAPAGETQTSTASQTKNPIARLFHQRSVTSGLIGAYATGAALGVLDWAGLHHLDHPVHQDTSGLWSIARAGQFPAELIGVTLAGAVWEGGNNRLGRTLWQSVDAAAIAGISTQALKYTFQRERPSQTSDPNQWFQGMHAQSFPSGDVSSITALVTPLILEYHRTDPWIYTLAAVPAFDMAARVKAHGHWQTDVVSGAAVGMVSGYFAHRFKEPFILSLLPNGFYVGLRKGF